jgi:hypothetical protein
MIFPLICSKLLECVINKLLSRNFRGSNFVAILEQQVMGFSSKKFI